MNIPYIVFLIPYFIGVGFFFLWTFFNLYHIIKFGFFDFTGKLNTAIFGTLACIVFIITALLLKDVAWLDTIAIFESFDAANPFENVTDLDI